MNASEEGQWNCRDRGNNKGIDPVQALQSEDAAHTNPTVEFASHKHHAIETLQFEDV